MQPVNRDLHLEFSQEACQRRLQAIQWIPAPLETVKAFFLNPQNLAALTPPRQKLRMVAPCPLPARIEEGMRVEYRLQVAGIPLRWVAKMEAVTEDGFTDVMLRGPYRSWRHTHRFVEKDGGTLVVDEIQYVTYTCRYGHKWFIRPQLEKIFAARGQALKTLFPASA